METTKFCLVGAGRTGLVHGRNIVHGIAAAELTAIVEPDAQTAQRFFEEVIECRCFPTLGDAISGAEFDAVVICAPTFVHKELTVTAARAGKHIFCEKPIALTLDECVEMAGAVEQGGVLFQMGFMRRYDSSFREAKSQIDGGKIGEVMYVRTFTRGPGLPPDWACNPETSNGMLAEVNSHDFDCVRWLTGSEIVEVFAQAGTFKCPELKQRYPLFYDNAVVTLRMHSGAIATIHGACPVSYGYDARAEVLGTEGLLEIGSLRSLDVERCRRDEGIVSPQSLSWRALFREAYLEELRSFVDCIRSGKQPAPTLEDGQKALAAVIAANQSIREGRPVKVTYQP